jgi:hypothetical protein
MGTAGQSIVKVLKTHKVRHSISRDALIKLILASPRHFLIVGCRDGDRLPENEALYPGHIAHDNKELPSRETVVRGRLSSWIRTEVERGTIIKNSKERTYRLKSSYFQRRRPISPEPVFAPAPPAPTGLAKTLHDAVNATDAAMVKLELSVREMQAEIASTVQADKCAATAATAEQTAIHEARAAVVQRESDSYYRSLAIARELPDDIREGILAVVRSESGTRQARARESAIKANHEAAEINRTYVAAKRVREERCVALRARITEVLADMERHKDARAKLVKIIEGN